MIKTVAITPKRLSTTQCKICGEVATFISYDTKGNDVGPQYPHCAKCRNDARHAARWFIALPKTAKRITDFLG